MAGEPKCQLTREAQPVERRGPSFSAAKPQVAESIYLFSIGIAPPTAHPGQSFSWVLAENVALGQIHMMVALLSNRKGLVNHQGTRPRQTTLATGAPHACACGIRENGLNCCWNANVLTVFLLDCSRRSSKAKSRIAARYHRNPRQLSN